MKHFPLFLLVALCICSCNRNTVKLSHTNAENEVPVLGNLVFKFSDNLATDSMLNHWDSTEYIRFSPAIKGRFRWEAKDQLVFSPSGPLEPATGYKAVFSEKILLGQTAFTNLEGTGNIEFKTPDLELEQHYFRWAKADGSAAPLPVIELHFNYPVSPEVLEKGMRVMVDELPAKPVFETLAPSPVMKVKLIGFNAEDREYKVKVTVQKGLKPEGGKNGLPEDKDYEGQLSSPFVLLVNDVTTEHDGATGSIYVGTNQEITGNELANFVAIEPAVKFSVETTDNGLLITSPGFSAENSYSLTLKPGLKGQLGGVLKEPFEAALTFGELEPSLSFANQKAVYLGAAGQKNIELRITNVPKIKVTVSKVYENNLLAAEQYGYQPVEQYDGEYYDYTPGYDMGDILFEQEIDTRSLPKYGSGRLYHFNPNDQLPGYKGVYHISVRSVDEYWVSSSRFISLSDIGIIAKAGGGKMLVFTNSIHSANPLSGVGVQVYAANNQLIGNGSTNGEGVAEIKLQGNDVFSGFKPAMVVARLADDFNYLPFAGTGVNTSKYQVGGKKINNTGIDAFIAPERDLYRPGETIHFAVVARDGNRKSPGAIPVKLKLVMPNGKELTQLRKTLDEEGVTDAMVPLPISAITGTYTLELYNGNDVLIRTNNFRVEEFVPDRIKVTAKTDKEVLKPGIGTALTLEAVNYFGPPAAGRKYEAEVEIREKPFHPAGFYNYDFSLSNRPSFFDNILRQGVTNEEGKATEAFEIPDTYRGMGILQARFFATVFDENGRPVSRNTKVDLLTQDVMVGVGNSGYNYFPLNKPVRFPLVALDPKEKVTTARVQVSVVKHEYRTVLQKSGGYFRYESQKEEKLLQKQEMNVQGATTAFNFIPKLAGEYELRVALPGSNTYVSNRFYSYGSWGSNIGDFEVNSDGQVDISVDKNGYKKGDKVKALFKAPFDGKMLVTLESSELLHHQWVQVKNRMATIDFTLSDPNLPNTYITATLFKPHTTGTALPLTAAHGILNIDVKDEGKRIPVSIQAPVASRSMRKQRINVKANPGSMVCLAAVDNGILAVTGFRSPDPFEYYFGKRALGVEAWDLYPLLFPELRRTGSSTGGDGDLSMDLRQNPFATKRFQLMSYWGGWRRAVGGNAVFELDIPSFNGQVRMMAIAVSGDKFGAAEATMQVADPLVLSASMPRFMAPGDTVYAGVTISNTTNKAATVSTMLQAVGPLQPGRQQGRQLTIAPNSEERLEFPLYANQTPGMGKLTVTASGLGEEFKETIEISIRPASTLQQRTGSGIADAGSKVQLDLPVQDFLPATLDYGLVVGRSPVLQLGAPLRYLVNYPYGCTEQTISSAFPQLYFGALSELMKEAGGFSKAAYGNVQDAIQKIKMRQLYNGALTMWDREGGESWWVTAYGAHFLLEARKAGYVIDNALLETMLQYLTKKLRKREMVDYYFNGNLKKRIAPKEVAYSLYVLALAGRANVPAMNYYKANSRDLALDGRYALAASYALAGDKKGFREMLPTTFAGEVSVSTGNGSLYSALRDEALALNVLLEVDPGHAQVPIMARHIVERLNTQKYFTTQEASFSLLAIGKLAKEAGKSTAVADIFSGGKKAGVMTGEVLKLTKKQMPGHKITLDSRGSGKYYYWWHASGVSATGRFVQEDNYLKVRRQLYDRYGREIAGNTFKQNDLIVVKLTLEKTFNGRVENIVVTDLLPGGWEIENPRIKEMAGSNWIKDDTQPLSLDVRDDRIHFFTDMNTGRQVFYYAVRAVTGGNYQLGPLSADAMYQPEYHSYSGFSKIRVIR